MPTVTLAGDSTDRIPGHSGRKGLVAMLKTAGPVTYAFEGPPTAGEGIPLTTDVPVSFVSPDNKMFAGPIYLTGATAEEVVYTDIM